MDKQPVSFPNWKDALAVTGFPPGQQATYTREIISFLRFCKTRHVPVSAELARQYLEIRETQTTAPAREALRWFYRAARAGGASTPAPAAIPRPAACQAAQEPPLAAADRGGADIRTFQELLGHANVETTQIYLHVMKKPGLGVRSPLDQ